MRRTWLVVAILLCITTPAAAEDVTKLFPLSGAALPKALKSAPSELTRVLAKSFKAEVTNVPIEDAAELMECDLAARKCLDAIARSVGATTIIFGRIERRDAGMIVKLTSYDALKGEQQRSFVIEGETAEALATSLTERIEQANNPKPTEPDPPIEVPPITPVEVEPTAGKITTGTWSMIVGGAVTTGVGAVFLVSARGLAKDVRRAPTETREDIDRLVALEKAGRTRTQIGGALMIVGGAVATVGVVRAILQRREPSHEKPLIDVVPEQGGASVLFTVGWK